MQYALTIFVETDNALIYAFMSVESSSIETESFSLECFVCGFIVLSTINKWIIVVLLCNGKVLIYNGIKLKISENNNKKWDDYSYVKLIN